MSLSNEQVQAEMRKMISFIKQEALEKAKEIHTLSEEEFQLEKEKIVRQQCSAIDEEFDGKMKRAAMSQRIARSNVLNKSRLEILNTRESVMDDIMNTVCKKLEGIEKIEDKYVAFLRDLIVQSMLSLNEKIGIVCGRKVDLPLIEKALPEAVELYEKASGLTGVQLAVDEEEPLDDDCLGGVVVLGFQGKIRSVNTIKARLELIKEQALPQIREILFGKNPHRTFLD
ncbi:V-type ATPase V1 subunit E [Schizosaccharomyces japonicus yFS275]|uniref:V-type ATPase V1 subunit E n=1 Tax=Schizosaccharomyces japonicus (strain yFS275 / FY16936) TaxID=402676 RepID=B6JV12_SCHJY|nr:V-type ATPase V1 subunit E [Schizosaccharomyces japonicus yFS275]EEB05213.1 V-type ATPase V1 subunit E [Schizosaccharomyces japonicus yFS275]